MRLQVVAASNRQPDWAQNAWDEFARRFSAPDTLSYTQVRLSRERSAAARKAAEGKLLLAAVERGATVIALDERGRGKTTRELADQLERWALDAVRPCFVIGGPDGLDAGVLDAAAMKISLSPLTLPHALARVILVEALYRAQSLRSGHPYHRE